MTVKSVCGSILSREEITKLLNKKLTPPILTQLLEVVSKKLIWHKYVEIPHEPVDHSKLRLSTIKEHKEIEL